MKNKKGPRDMQDAHARGGWPFRANLAFLSVLCLLLPGILFLLPVSHVSAQDPAIDLELGQETSAPWVIENLKPGDSAVRSIEVRNLGSRDGQLAIWISNLREYDFNGDGAHLGEYLKFEVRSSGLFTTLEMPASIRNFPSSPIDPNYIWVINIQAGGSATIEWYWEFEDNFISQNDAQGDRLSFTVNYMLGDMPPPSSDLRWMRIEMLGELSIGALDLRGKAVQRINADDGSGQDAIMIEKGTRCLTDNDEPLDRLELSEFEGRLTAPKGQVIIGPVYSLRGYDEHGNASVGLFNRGASLILAYDPALLPYNTTLVGLYYHTASSGWVPLPQSGLGGVFLGRCEGLINRSGQIAIMATFDPVKSAYFLPSDLLISPSQMRIWDPVTFVVINGDQVTITVIVTNIGQVGGTGNITLEMNGQAVSRQELTLAPLESQQLCFTLAGLNQGSYNIKVAGLNGQFTVATEINWWLIFGFTLLFAGVISGGAYSIKRWRETRNRMTVLQRSLQMVETRMAEYQGTILYLKESQQQVNQAALMIQVQMLDMQERLSQDIMASRSPSTAQVLLPIYPSFQRAALKEEKASIDQPVKTVDNSRAPSEPDHSINAGSAIEMTPVLHPNENAKDRILRITKESGSVPLESITRSKEPDVAIKALVSLIQEKKVRAVQRNQRVVIVPEDSGR